MCANARGRVQRGRASHGVLGEPPSHSLSWREACLYLRPAATGRSTLEQRRRGLAESAGVHLLRERLYPALLIKLDGRVY